MAPASVVSAGVQGRGKKRPAADELEGEQRRLAKKFGLLHIAHIPNPLNPQNDSPHTSLVLPQPAPGPGADQHPIPVAAGPAAAAPATAPTTAPDEFMQVDETKHRVYIHDLDSEIAEIEAHENNANNNTPFIRADIEKRVICVPKSVLGANSGSSKSVPSTTNALVLYRLPSSLSVPEVEDGVRMAAIEARERARARAEAAAAAEKEKAKEVEMEKELETGQRDPGMIISRYGSSLDLLASSTSATLPSPEPLDLDSPYDAEPMEIDDS
ncbi:hypothetical protein RJZ56_001355 [Blastomyces dermatitidis]|uniref:Uncharacterized protein n=3 Tax=Blastomyces TaxID=229219 RepID=A0A179U6I3_BLAGS|nr:uncharacterized protein BDBG_00155 [Blastomyces gilchristii SLH14081]XP_045273052.1 uncharacterized protein BDCG_08528 [Blastomyces dermatitidis ER-3]EEQ85259.1 hypothetical protein BDCG_08528 [Blastomyces dermatitidis ER-3]EGE78321.2 hypothetical protein BDDG_01258 [Blastomyces dermatitidis ATCC 18188]OAT03430.1 hypothetical protein BDBG_00155 [Blastomyces gilchristii SLH14081]